MLGPFVAFFGTGYFSGFGARRRRALSDRGARDRRRLLLQLRPHRERRGAVHDRLGRRRRSGFGVAFAITGAAFLLAALAWIWIPETRNRELT